MFVKENEYSLLKELLKGLTIADLNDKFLDEAKNSKDLSFAVFRYSGEDKFTFLMKKEGCVRVEDYKNLKSKSGFLVSPFIKTTSCPTVFIEPDYVEECLIDSIPQFSTPNIRVIDDNPNTLYSNYKKGFAFCKQNLKDETLQKVVFSRRLNLRYDGKIPLMSLFKKSCEYMPNCYVSMWWTPYTGLWLVATPEVLLKNNPLSNKWETMALAGTSEWKGILPALNTWSLKNREEHQYVVDYIIQRLHRKGIVDVNISDCYSSRAGNIVHLRTDISFDMIDKSNFWMVVEELHPTPAVCGTPFERALQCILGSEASPRKYYAGFSGPINIKGKTGFFVSLRCMELFSDYATLYAGGGLLKESVLEDEWDETCRKLHTMERLFQVER